MQKSYHVRLCKERFVFSAAHFITYHGDICEPLHGHNYHVEVEVHGPLDENHYVVDFIAVRDAVQEIVDGFDHRMLLPTQHKTIHVVEQDGAVEVTHERRRWVFPREDCVLLPVANTTAERLAQIIAERLLNRWGRLSKQQPTRLRVAVDECDGQWGVYEISEPGESS
jgi:6-pyruvoyltetrahydropterin/6-carboxytetrahydropterin synthase